MLVGSAAVAVTVTVSVFIQEAQLGAEIQTDWPSAPIAHCLMVVVSAHELPEGVEKVAVVPSPTVKVAPFVTLRNSELIEEATVVEEAVVLVDEAVVLVGDRGSSHTAPSCRRS